MHAMRTGAAAAEFGGRGAVAPSSRRAGAIASSSGSPIETPAPRRKVRREICQDLRLIYHSYPYSTRPRRVFSVQCSVFSCSRTLGLSPLNTENCSLLSCDDLCVSMAEGITEHDSLDQEVR